MKGGRQVGYALIFAMGAALALAAPALSHAEMKTAGAAPLVAAATTGQDEVLARLTGDLAKMQAAGGGAPAALVRTRDDFGKDGGRLIREPGRNWQAAGPSLHDKPRDGGMYVRGQKVRYLQRF